MSRPPREPSCRCLVKTASRSSPNCPACTATAGAQRASTTAASASRPCPQLLARARSSLPWRMGAPQIDASCTCDGPRWGCLSPRQTPIRSPMVPWPLRTTGRSSRCSRWRSSSTQIVDRNCTATPIPSATSRRSCRGSRSRTPASTTSSLPMPTRSAASPHRLPIPASTASFSRLTIWWSRAASTPWRRRRWGSRTTSVSTTSSPTSLCS